MVELKRGKKKIFTYAQARSILPIVKKITAESIERAGSVLIQLEGPLPEGRRIELDDRLTEIVDHWAEQMLSLGCRVKGLWRIDFDKGDGYFCWKHPETDIANVHSYDGGFESREKIN